MTGMLMIPGIHQAVGPARVRLARHRMAGTNARCVTEPVKLFAKGVMAKAVLFAIIAVVLGLRPFAKNAVERDWRSAGVAAERENIAARRAHIVMVRAWLNVRPAVEQAENDESRY